MNVWFTSSPLLCFTSTHTHPYPRSLRQGFVQGGGGAERARRLSSMKLPTATDIVAPGP